MMTTAALKAKRDAAWAEYLAVRKAGGRSPAKLATLIRATRRWYRAGGMAKPDYTVAGWINPKLDKSILGKP